jgi:hypothetical protein
LVACIFNYYSVPVPIVAVIPPVTVNVVPSNVKLPSPLIELASENVATLLLTPLEPSTRLVPQTRESISSVFRNPSESLITTELSTPVDKVALMVLK